MPELPTSYPFEWVRYPWGSALQCRPLAALAAHCFTTRQPVIPDDAGSPGDGWQRVAMALGLPRSAIVRLRQVHGSRILSVRNGSERPQVDAIGGWGVGDAAITNDSSIAPCVKTADCVPLLIASRSNGAVAAVHAGWRGAAAGVIAAAVAEFQTAFGADTADLVAAVGPSIGPCCYRVGAELRDSFAAAGHRAGDVDAWFTATPKAAALYGVPGTVPESSDGRAPLWLDMWAVVDDQLKLAGLAPSDVHVSRLCTSCGRDTFHSYRVDGPAAGRMVAVIRSRG